MKKTKVLIPALGILLLSTAATVSGSLAWFTANRSATVNTNQFAVEAIDGTLKRTLVNGTGTQVTGANAAAVYGKDQIISPLQEGDPSKDVTLTDASFDYASQKLFTDVPNDLTDASGDPAQPVAYTEVSNWATKAYQVANSGASAGHETVYYAFTWTAKFAYEFKSDHSTMNVFFDVDGSKCVAKNSEDDEVGTEGNLTYKGFRIAILPLDATGAVVDGQEKVWMPFETSTSTQKRVTTVSTATEYTNADKVICSDSAYQTDFLKAVDKEANASQRLDYIGQIEYKATPITTSDASLYSSELAVTFVAWYEGEDTNVVNGAEMDKVQAALKFYARQA